MFLKPHFGVLSAVLVSFLRGGALSAPVLCVTVILHGFCAWLAAFGDRMLKPEHFQFV